jgi:cell cycle checkpoint control protein RAD9A
MLDHFSLAASSVPTGVGNIRNENQLGWMFGKNEVRVKSWEGGGRDLSTEIKVNPEEFEDYWVEQERVDLTLPMKEFRVSSGVFLPDEGFIEVD